eukprot:4370357-Lingulodinium_polyedra.AAC.1
MVQRSKSTSIALGQKYNTRGAQTSAAKTIKPPANGHRTGDRPINQRNKRKQLFCARNGGAPPNPPLLSS